MFCAETRPERLLYEYWQGYSKNYCLWGIAEKEILKQYKDNSQLLNSTILKVAHHGSKTSSTKEFLETVKPKISLIGVGENNKFGHPNEDVIKRLDEINSKIYRTDKMGEISISVDKNGKIKIATKNSCKNTKKGV